MNDALRSSAHPIELNAPLNESALLAEPALEDDWLNPEEDEAWAHLQPDKL